MISQTWAPWHFFWKIHVYGHVWKCDPLLRLIYYLHIAVILFKSVQYITTKKYFLVKVVKGLPSVLRISFPHRQWIFSKQSGGAWAGGKVSAWIMQLTENHSPFLRHRQGESRDTKRLHLEKTFIHHPAGRCKSNTFLKIYATMLEGWNMLLASSKGQAEYVEFSWEHGTTEKHIFYCNRSVICYDSPVKQLLVNPVKAGGLTWPLEW